MLLLGTLIFGLFTVLTQTSWAEEKAIKLLNEGNDYSKQGQFKKAIHAYQKAIKIDNTLSTAHYNLANIFVATGKTDESISEYKLAIKLNPLEPDYHRNLGFAYALQQNGEMAKKKYEDLKVMAPAQAEELLLWIQQSNQTGK
ncbi:MAG: tetratricopeptide repeat protein [Nitrospinales bacterium]